MLSFIIVAAIILSLHSNKAATNIICMGISTACMSMDYVCVNVLGGQERASNTLELELQMSLLSCGYWEQNSGPLQEGYVLLTSQPIFPVPKILLDKRNIVNYDGSIDPQLARGFKQPGG